MSKTKKEIHLDQKNSNIHKEQNMLIIKVKEGESIERALKHYKRKHRNVKVGNEIKERKYYTKKSVKRRSLIQKAEYVQRLKQESEN